MRLRIDQNETKKYHEKCCIIKASLAVCLHKYSINTYKDKSVDTPLTPVLCFFTSYVMYI